MADETEKQPSDPTAEAPESERQSIESSPFARCATCVHAEETDLDKGTLLCARHNMRIDADADEIPDDCPLYERDAAKQPPPDPSESPPAAPGGGA